MKGWGLRDCSHSMRAQLSMFVTLPLWPGDPPLAPLQSPTCGFFSPESTQRGVIRGLCI